MKSPARGGYVYPFPSAGTTTSRIDQGVDFGGSGGIVAIGRAKILKTKSPWPEYDGGAGILYELLEGPYKGRTVYVYEGVKPTVKQGEEVAAGQNIGTIIPGTSSGIETGWANRSTGQPISHSEFTGENETRAGREFKSFLASLPRRYLGKPGFGGIPSAAEEAGKIGVGGINNVPGLKQAEELSEGEKSLGGIAGEVVEGIAGDLASHAEPLMLNIALLGLGAFFVYYGAALMLGVKKPIATPLKSAGKAGAVGAAAA